MVLDENLPTFHVAPLSREEPHITPLSYSTNGSAPQPAYTKTRLPNIPNTYSTTLHDSFVPDILYASVTAFPEIQHLAPSPDGSPPPEPRVILPQDFTIKLFNPDSEVRVELHHSTLRGNYWEFDLPKTSFLPPSASKLDAASSAAVIAHLPKATFRWKKEGGMLSRTQLRCFLVSPGNLGPNGKKAGGNEPDIPIAMFSGLGDKKGVGQITIYESNLNRVEIEDLKGLEVVLVLGATVIGDVWFTSTNTVFNLTVPIANGVIANGKGKKTPSPGPAVALKNPPPNPPSSSNSIKRRPVAANTSPTAATTSQNTFASRYQSSQSPSPTTATTPTGPLPPVPAYFQYSSRADEKQLIIAREEAEARLEAQRLQEAEAQRIAAEAAQIRRMLAEEEARERQRKEAAIEAETQRLRREYERERQEYMRRGATAASARPPPTGPHGRPIQLQQQQQQQQRPVSYHQRPAILPPRPTPPMVVTPAVGGRLVTPDSGKRLDSGGKRKSFMGLKFFGSGDGASSSSSTAVAATAVNKKEEARRKKLVKKGSSMW